MNLILLFDHRFYVNDKNIIFSPKNYDYRFFLERYLTVFDRVTIAARVKSISSDLEYVQKTEGPGVEVLSLGNWMGSFDLVMKLPNIINRIRTQLDTQSAFIMIIPGMIGTLMYPALYFKRYPYGVEVVGDPYDTFSPEAFNHPARPLIRWFTFLALKSQCFNATANTYVTAKFLQQRYPPNPQSFSTYSSDVELVYIEAPPEIDFSVNKFRLINVGTMAQLYKAHDILIEALGICIEQGLNVFLTLVGDGKHRIELETNVKNRGLSERVVFCGQLPAGDSVRKQLDQSDLFVMPSRQEGLPRAMIEAMGRGLPCIGTRIGGIPELLEDEHLVPVNDSKALALKIREVLLDPQRRKKMSERNLEVAKQFQPEFMQDRREIFYKHLKEKTTEWIEQNESK